MISETPILFAPLQGYTEAFYRMAHARAIGGILEYYTPFIRLEKGILRRRDINDTSPEKNTGINTVPQILVRQKEDALSLISYLAEAGYRRIDFNFGCPFPKIVKQGAGAGLLPHPEKVQEILSVTERFPTIEFSVKMRAGAADPGEAEQLLPILNDTPLKHIVLHPRLAVQQYRGTPDLRAFQTFAEQCTPSLFYNGDIRSADDVERLKQILPDISGFMIGRGLLNHPFLSQEILLGRKLTPEEQANLVSDFHAEVLKNLQETEQLLPELKTLWEYLLPDADTRLRKKILKSRTFAEYLEFVSLLLKNMRNHFRQ